MSSETSRKGSIQRGDAYEEVGPELGQLHDAWDVRTGQAVLQLLPTERVDWRPEAPWRVILECEPEPTTVTVRVEESPASMPLSELANLLALTTSAVTRVEGSARLRAHLASSRTPAAGASASGRAFPRWAGVTLALGVCGLAMIFAVGIRSGGDVSSELGSSEDASSVVDLADSGVSPVSYPMPREPFLNQAVPPCNRSKAVVAINGGCWVVLEQKPPCDETDAAEYQGKCYMPVGKSRRLPQSVDP
ncbi:MAG: hypothetical protein ABW123_16240 [Cystobacter sp.]